MNVTVIFDGDCGLCTRTIRILQRWDRRESLQFRPCQSIPTTGWRGIWPSQCAQSVWAIADDGSFAGGSDAAYLILTSLLGNRWPYRIGRLPIIQQVSQAVYRIIAINRRRFPGDVPWCQQDPQGCCPEDEY